MHTWEQVFCFAAIRDGAYRNASMCQLQQDYSSELSKENQGTVLNIVFLHM